MAEVTYTSFTKPFTGASDSYSSFMLIGDINLWDVIKVINDGKIDFTYYKVDDPNDGMSGILGATEYKVCAKGKISTVVEFRIFGEMPELVHDFTKALKCRGYADTAWDEYYMVASESGKDFNGYYAEGDREEREEDDCYDMFVTVVDPSGAVFETGAGDIEEDRTGYYETIVANHYRRVC